ncbi:MAG TPA: tetratricopeptide repeat protein [Symbiobacteriaceae bacterium]|nr:tetratricopeptide repeat protein [Symbiobacteriaceae bacterium]
MRRHYVLALALVGALLTACTKEPAPAPTPVSAPTAGESKESLNDKAFAAIQQKDWATAISLGEQAVQQDPNFAPARFNLGLALYRAGKFTEALPHLEKAYELNKEQVEPGWFLALTLEQTNQADRAVTVLQELAQRFPGDKDVHQKLSALSPTPVVWRLAPGLSQVTFLGARVVAAESSNTVAAFDADGAVLWRTAGNSPVAKLVADDTGKLLAVVREESLDLVNATTGALLGTQPLRWEDRNGKGGPWTTWHGEMLYVGIDQWLGDHYASTGWQIHRTTDRGLEQLAFVGPARQGIQVSLDGHRAVIQDAGGERNVYVDGVKTWPVTGEGDLDPRGDRLYWRGPDGQLSWLSFDGAKHYFSAKQPAGHTLWNPWPRPDGLWVVSVRPVDGGWAAYDGPKFAFSGERGGPTGYYANYLVIQHDRQTEIVDRTGKVAMHLAAENVRLTPDEQWAYFQTNDQIKSFRLP